MRIILLIVGMFTLSACGNTGIPRQVVPVEGFELQRYLGTWYEIARLDHSFERGLSNVTANYSLREDGGVRVLNRGYEDKAGEWDSAIGKAYFVDQDGRAHLKVSFFGPFYGSYIVFELDQQGYQYALISGPDTSYLWILARQPKLDAEVQARLLAKARAAGFDVSQMIFVRHDRPQPGG